MKILSLNCRGLGNPCTVTELHEILKTEEPKIVFLMETRLRVRSLEFLRVFWGMNGCFGVERHWDGYGGGLC
jgi:hypothetical protein